MTVPYRPSPTLSEFHEDAHFVRGLMGPFGSGKSVGCCWEIVLRCMRQNKQEDGFRRSRWVCVRNTTQQLKDTTLKTWMDWIPEGVMGHYKVSDATFMLEFEDVRAEILFRPLDTPDDVKRLLSLELTGAWVNEAREIPKAIIDGITGRIGRYPREADGGSQWNGIIMDTNPPDEDHWWYEIFEVQSHKDPQVKELYRIFKQPPAMFRKDGRWEINPEAENLQNLPKSYYPNMTIGKSEEWIKVYVEGKYGIVSDGRPVYDGYNDEWNCREFDFDPNLPVYVGWDYSFHGQACVLAQLSPRGQLRIFDEFVGEGVGLHNFILNSVKPGLSNYKASYARSTGDPAGAKRGDLDEKFALEMLNDGYEDMLCQLPFDTEAADTNSLSPRTQGVEYFLNRTIEGAPAMLLHPRCATLRKGFQGRYEFKRVAVVGEERYKDVPAKNKYSHPQDALQYLCRGILCDAKEEEDDEYYSERRVGLSGY